MAPLETQKQAPYTDAEESSVRAIVDATSPHSEVPFEESQALDHPEVQRILGVYEDLGETRKKYAVQRSVYRAINQLLDLADETDDLVEKRRAATAVLRFFIYDQRHSLKGDPAASGHTPRVAAPRVPRPIKRTDDDLLRESDHLALGTPGRSGPGSGSPTSDSSSAPSRPKQTAAPPRRSRKDKKRQKRPAKQKSTAHQSDPAHQRAGPGPAADPSPAAPSGTQPDAAPSETPAAIPFPSSDTPTPIKSLTARAGAAPHNTS